MATPTPTPTPDEIWKILKENAVQIHALEARQAETAELVKETTKTVDEVGKQLGRFTNNAGRSNEELFYRSFSSSKELGGERYDTVERNIRKRADAVEIDIIMANGRRAAVLEVKNRASADDIEALRRSKVALARALYPQCKEIYFGIATMIVDDGLEQAAREAQIYLVTQSGGHVEVVNDQVKAF